MIKEKKGKPLSPDYHKSKAQLVSELETLHRQLTTQQIIALERLRVEEALAREKEQLSVTLHSIGDGVITTDSEGRVVVLNSVAQKLLGWSEAEVYGTFLEEFFHIVNEHTGLVVANPVKDVLETGLIQGLAKDTILIARDGTTHIITDSTAPIYNPTTGQISGVVFVFRDITQQKQLEQELYKVQKLESIGVLAGGIAHDFNNILAALTTNLWLARAELRASILISQSDNVAAKQQREAAYNTVVELLVEAEAAAFRAKDLTGQLLTFAKGGAPLTQTISPKILLEETVRFSLRGSKVQVVFYLPLDLWSVEADSGQLGQVITNLVINAQQAMPNGGILRVNAENISADATSQQTHLLTVPLKAVDYIKVSIEDNGLGIPDQILGKIFDPYFSTKQKGSGLGLATAYSIINRHGGVLSVLSEMGKGTTFLIYLPAIKSTQIVLPPISSPATETTSPHKERLLIMDDEKPLITVLKRVLMSAGYSVDTVADGASAIELYKTALVEKRPYDAVILDLTIPGGMGGVETIAQLRQIDPQIKAIVMSGYSDSGALSQYQEYGFMSIISKPFRMKDLYQTIENVLLIEA